MLDTNLRFIRRFMVALRSNCVLNGDLKSIFVIQEFNNPPPTMTITFGCYWECIEALVRNPAPWLSRINNRRLINRLISIVSHSSAYITRYLFNFSSRKARISCLEIMSCLITKTSFGVSLSSSQRFKPRRSPSDFYQQFNLIFLCFGFLPSSHETPRWIIYANNFDICRDFAWHVSPLDIDQIC